MLQDAERVERFQQAIASTVQPGNVVLDVGSGTGLLSFLALQGGAARVYAVEMGRVIELARQVAAANGYDDRIVFLHNQSTRVTLPEKVDVIVSETIGNFGLDEGIVEWVADAAARHLKPGGRIIPQSLRLFAAPVEAPELYRRVEEWSSAVYGIDYAPAGHFATNQLHWAKFAGAAFLSEPQPWANVRLREAAKGFISGAASFTCTRDGNLHGIGGWFEAELCPGIFVSNSPASKTSSWSHGLLLLQQPVPVRSGDRIDVKLSVHANGSQWRWRGRCTRPVEGKPLILAEFDHNTFEGQLLLTQALRRRAATYVPTLSTAGQADRFILSLIDGQTPLGDIARQAADRFPAHFADRKAALEQARKLAERYRA